MEAGTGTVIDPSIVFFRKSFFSFCSSAFRGHPLETFRCIQRHSDLSVSRYSIYEGKISFDGEPNSTEQRPDWPSLPLQRCIYLYNVVYCKFHVLRTLSGFFSALDLHRH